MRLVSKLSTLALVFFASISVQASSTCEVMIAHPAEAMAGKISGEIKDASLALRALSRTQIQDAGSEQFDFTLTVEALSDSRGKMFAVLSVSSQKLLNTLYGPGAKKCNLRSSTVFTTSALMSKSERATAAHLVSNLPSCELLKEFETRMLRQLYCE